MPRMKGGTAEFGPMTDPLEDTIISVGENITTTQADTQYVLNEVILQLRKTHLGHELYSWDAEVDQVE